jgi:hypothetical protein
MGNSTFFFSKYDNLMSFFPKKTFIGLVKPPFFFGHEETKFLPKINKNHVESCFVLPMKRRSLYGP